jgi:hypothetical protein
MHADLMETREGAEWTDKSHTTTSLSSLAWHFLAPNMRDRAGRGRVTHARRVQTSIMGDVVQGREG